MDNPATVILTMFSAAIAALFSYATYLSKQTIARQEQRIKLLEEREQGATERTEILKELTARQRRIEAAVERLTRELT